MIRRAIDDIGEADLATLVTNNVTEGRTLEFKQELPGGSDSDLKEFLADVTSLANAQGGDLIFGMKDKSGIAEQLIGLSIDADAAILRLENILRDGVEPRLSGIRIRWISLQNGQGAIVLRVPPSLAAPHRIRFKNSGRFFNRNSRGKYEMDTYELRQAFNASEEFPTRLKELHQQAIRSAKGKDFPFGLPHDPSVVLSVLPLSFLRERRDVPVTEETAVIPSRSSGALTYAYTLEGVLFRTPLNPDNTARSYTLTHRRGRVDAAWTIGGSRELEGGKTQRMVFAKYYREGILDIARTSVARLRSFGIEGPWIVFATLLNIRNSRLGFDDYSLSEPTWRDELTFIEVIADEISDETLRPLFDSFPLVYGIPASRYRYPA